MKRCPTCQQTFSDPNLSFCIDDGTPLQNVEAELDTDQDEATVVSSSSKSGPPPAPPYEPPGGYLPPGTPPGQDGKRSAWPWVVGCLALLLITIVGLIVTAKLLYPKIKKPGQNTNKANVIRESTNSNLNANSSPEPANLNANDNSDWQLTPPPTDESEVLAALTDLEHEWTVANINADKKKLERILGDDYVSTAADGKTQGKAEYLRTIERDTVIQKWEFDDLKVSLRGARASLTGVLRLEAKNEQGEVAPLAFAFTDKFVWRDDRWQAVSSVVKPAE